MKTTILSSLLLASGCLFVSCKEEEKTETAAQAVPSVYEVLNGNKVAAAPTQTPAQTPANVSVTPPVLGTATAMPPAPVPVAKGMNPSHGQPGHRCDIPVGAPLNSPPGKKVTPPAPGKAVMTSSTTAPGMTVNATTPTPASPGVPALLNAPTPITTAPGMNPPHGQPGHRCDIAVGAPLAKTEEKKEEKKE